MKLELNKLYHYIYGDWANLEKHVKPDLDSQLKQKLVENRKQQLLQFFSSFKQNLLPYIREQKNSYLEKLLTDKRAGRNEIKYPDETEINTYLDQMEKNHRLLQDEKGALSTEARKQFNQYFKICKLVGDIIECNNEVNNSTAYTHAYKLLVLFGNHPNNMFRVVDDYLKTFNYWNTSNKPLHDALIYALPVIDSTKIHLDDWRKLIQKFGYKAFKLFNLAPAIEKELNRRCPKDLTEARDIAQGFHFKRAKEYPELAELFLEFELNEPLFNRTLEINKKRKTKDNLPDVLIFGDELSPAYPEYVLTKLPIDDPRAYVLGELTDCCQSMGGHSEECVVDGVTRENNGFYVLLKSKLKEHIKKEFQKIDYQKYEIVGQGYAWISEQGNLVIDSWENKNPLHDDKVIVPFLNELGRQVVMKPESTSLCVLIGKGGKTPEFWSEAKEDYAERMKEGFQYGDSKKQSMIFINNKLRAQFVSEIQNEIDRIKKIDEYKLASDIKEKCFKRITDGCFSRDYMMVTKAILNSDKVKFIFNYDHHTHWTTVIALYNANSLTPDLMKFYNMGKGFVLQKNNKIPAHLLEKLRLAGITQFHFQEKVLTSDRPDHACDDLIAALPMLKEAHIENEESCLASYIDRAVVDLQVEYDISLTLKEAGLDNNSNAIHAVMTCFESHHAACALLELVKASIPVTQDIISGLRKFYSAYHLSDALIRLSQLKLDKHEDIQKRVLYSPNYASTDTNDRGHNHYAREVNSRYLNEFVEIIAKATQKAAETKFQDIEKVYQAILAVPMNEKFESKIDNILKSIDGNYCGLSKHSLFMTFDRFAADRKRNEDFSKHASQLINALSSAFEKQAVHLHFFNSLTKNYTDCLARCGGKVATENLYEEIVKFQLLLLKSSNNADLQLLKSVFNKYQIDIPTSIKSTDDETMDANDSMLYTRNRHDFINKIMQMPLNNNYEGLFTFH